MNYLKRFYSFLINQFSLIRILFIILLLYHGYYRLTTGKHVNKLYELYGKNNYDINKLPNGIIIYKSIEPKLDENDQLYYYDIGIWDYSVDQVFYIKVPQYAHARFIVGMELRPELEEHNENNSDKKREEYKSPNIQV